MDENAFDIAVIGTSLAESIVAAALAKAGLRVLHLDESPNYGGRDASLSMIELHHFLLSPPGHITNLSAPIPISQELLRESRHYALSLSPSIVPSTGPLVDTLVGSGVARYVPFKLLDAVGLYSHQGKEAGSNGPVNGEQVRLVPASKEDVFKSKDLGLLQKRKLMKFLLSTATSNTNQPTDTQPLGAQGAPFRQHLTSKAVGLDKDTADAIAYALALSQDPDEPAESSLLRLKKYILSTGRHGNSPFIVGHFGGAGELAQGFCRASAVAGGTYILGRPYKIQRSSPKSSEGPDVQEPTNSSNPVPHAFEVTIEALDDILKARLVVSTEDALPASLRSEHQLNEESCEYFARCIAILDSPILFKRSSSPNDVSSASNEDVTEPADEEDGVKEEGKKEAQELDVDSAVLVFPPGSLGPDSESRVVTAFIAGPSSMACPEGKRVVYISTESTPQKSPEDALQPYLSAIQSLNRTSEEPSQVHCSIFYTHRRPRAGSSPIHTSDENERIIRLHPPSTHIAEGGDETAQEATRVFWETIVRLELDGRTCTREKDNSPPAEASSQEAETEKDDLLTTMWPPLTNDETGTDDD
ncbi:Rab proteins geranylgeranyltransferase component A [Serendipita sp. 401]|nr:Rab proteins geranylgeranyltransferase component A [Serendipita sp. 401]KAG8836072.1 Rab proteins geranylgeranyltransferase component A [Serendipita sp. 400]KAG9058437.1 Rab proteins geranylgeranyltransferase component A [Serendipita sp. 407]